MSWSLPVKMGSLADESRAHKWLAPGGEDLGVRVVQQPLTMVAESESVDGHVYVSVDPGCEVVVGPGREPWEVSDAPAVDTTDSRAADFSAVQGEVLSQECARVASADIGTYVASDGHQVCSVRTGVQGAQSVQSLQCLR